MIRRLRTAILVAATGTALAGVTLAMQVLRWSQQPVPLDAPVTFPFEPGTGLSLLGQELAHRGIVDNELYFSLYVRLFRRNYRLFQSGSYRFEGGMAPALLVDKFTKGENYHPIVRTIAVPEGFTLKALIDRLVAHSIGSQEGLRRMVRDPAFLKRFQVPAASLEGYVYPATYNFYAVPTPADALGEMVRTFWQNLPPSYAEKAAAMGLSLHQAVTFASLIELETQTDDERALVSEVIWRRLKDKAPIGIDAAIIYGIPDYAGDLKWTHLSDASNPYNTRIRKGLPPGPIGSPSRKSLEAVLSPANEGFYYYVLKAGTKRHHFSKTLGEHNRHVKELIAALRTKGHDNAEKPQASKMRDDDVKAGTSHPRAHPGNSPAEPSKVKAKVSKVPENHSPKADQP